MYLPRESAEHDAASLDMYNGFGGDPARLINAAFALNTIGQFALLILLATLLLSRAVYHHSSVMFNLLLICLAGSVPQYFLMYAGEIYNPLPPLGLCASQAALIDGLQCAFAVVALCLAVAYMVEFQVVSLTAMQAKYLQRALVALPYLTFLPFSSGVAIFGASHPEQVRHMPNDLTCILHNRTLITATRVVIATLVTLTLSLTTFAILHTLTTRERLYRKRLTVPSFSEAVRIAVFALFQAHLLTLDILRSYIQSDSVRVAYMILQALVPLITALNFGSKAECYQAWKGAAIGLTNKFHKRSCHQSAARDVQREMRINVDKSVCVVVD